jgi:predicted phage tail protein
VAPLQAAPGPQAATAPAMSLAWLLGTVAPMFGAVVLVLGTVAVLFYFFFSVEHKKVGSAVSKVGIWFLMVSFGASFGYTVMGRLSLLIGRVNFLLHDWLNIPVK